MGAEENKVQKEIMDYFNKPYSMIYKSQACADFPYIKNSKAFRINSKGIRGRKSTLPLGFSDVLVIITVSGGIALPLFIEVKAPGKKCTNKDQLDFIKDMNSMGCFAVWVNNIDDLKDGLRKWIFDLFVRAAEKKEQPKSITSLAKQN